MPAADRRAERHDRGAADVLQAAREDRVVGRVGQHDEAVGDELLGGEQQLGRVGQQRALVADDLELDPVGLERLAGEPRGQHRVARGEAAGGVRQQLDAGRVEHVDERAARRRIDAPQRDGDELGAARLGSRRPASRGAGSRRCRGSAASAARGRRSSSGSSAIGSWPRGQPPCIAVRTSTRAPSASATSGPLRRAGRPRRRRRPRRRGAPARRRASASSVGDRRAGGELARARR